MIDLFHRPLGKRIQKLIYQMYINLPENNREAQHKLRNKKILKNIYFLITLIVPCLFFRKKQIKVPFTQYN